SPAASRGGEGSPARAGRRRHRRKRLQLPDPGALLVLGRDQGAGCVDLRLRFLRGGLGLLQRTGWIGQSCGGGSGGAHAASEVAGEVDGAGGDAGESRWRSPTGTTTAAASPRTVRRVLCPA